MFDERDYLDIQQNSKMIKSVCLSPQKHRITGTQINEFFQRENHRKYLTIVSSTL